MLTYPTIFKVRYSIFQMAFKFNLEITFSPSKVSHCTLCYYQSVSSQKGKSSSVFGPVNCQLSVFPVRRATLSASVRLGGCVCLGVFPEALHRAVHSVTPWIRTSEAGEQEVGRVGGGNREGRKS